ncbi:ATP-grasp domain-containing protein [Virgibacillus pantothenticus]|uniref:ATP-grasp domain-containing protein n=1 Tax=Virgibacillus pantothenticus TaxID=1473 RepID=UPI000987A3B0|nr:ATP-grasp domain-containing protein [Virgibacillus pantothenticus]
MYNGWLIYSNEDIQANKAYIDWFIEEAALQSIQLELVRREDLMIGIHDKQQAVFRNGKVQAMPDFAVVRTIDPMLSLHLESCEILVFNNSRIATICNNKALTHHAVHQLHIPMVDTYYSKASILGTTPPLPFPFVIKDVAGRGGKQVYLITSEKEYKTCIQRLQRQEVIIQTCPVKPGKDLRVFVVGKKIVASVLRESDTDFRANYKLGGNARLYRLNEQEKNSIQTIVNAFDFGMVGIDFLISEQGELLFNEIEDVVGSRTLSAVSNENILRLYVEHINKQIELKPYR